VFFRAQTFADAGYLLGHMVGYHPDQTWAMVKGNEAALVAGFTAAMLVLHTVMRDTSLEAVANKTPWWLRACLLAAMVGAIVTMSGDDRAFIYFQF